MSPVLVTGAAGFIGMHVARRLLEDGRRVIGVDKLDPYYDVSLKEARLTELAAYAQFRFERLDLADAHACQALFASCGAREVIHLAAQAGVRYSLVNPQAYAQANLVGFLNVLEGCRAQAVQHLIYASTSSVYGASERLPFVESDRVDHPVSLYAATKKANELMAHSYSHLFRLPTTGLRFFTVYGPWGRPDMAPMLFTKAMLAGEPITVFSHGELQRDFTYIDDIVEGVVRLLPVLPAPCPESAAPYAVYNIGNHQALRVKDFIATLESVLGCRAICDYQPMQPGDVPATFAEISRLQAAVGFSPSTTLREGLERFVAWYRSYYAQGARA
ncbi:MAG: GDP-mannose 4,6-dehydratase [Betaproteobacteria bacterium]|nr:GDP-mannose 4,6-dehydratase [Betaproteobacteria bacterium]